MAISINATGSSAQGTGTATLNYIVTASSLLGDNAIYIGVASIGNLGSTGVTSMTYGSKSLSLVSHIISSGVGTDAEFEWWGAKDPSGGANTCTVNFGGVIDVLRAYTFILNGVDTGSLTEQTATFVNTIATITGQVTASTENCWILNGLCTKGDFASGTSGEVIDTGTVSGAANWVIELDAAIKATATTTLNGAISIARNGPVKSPQIQTGTWSGTAGVKDALSILVIKPARYNPHGSRFFNGTASGGSDLINLGNPASLNDLEVGNGLTWCVWYYSLGSGNVGFANIISKNDGDGSTPSAGTIWLFHNGDQTLLFQKDYATTDLQIPSSTTIATGVWTHIAISWDGGTSANGARMYFNGVEVAYGIKVDGSGTKNSDAALSYRIGNLGAAINATQGALSQVHLYARNLSQQEIRQLMFMPGSITKDLRSYLPLNGDGAPEPDFSGNKNGGAVTGTFPFNSPPTAKQNRTPRRNLIQIVKAAGGVTEEIANLPGSRVFNGTTDLITCSNLSSINAFTTYSVCAWIRIRTFSGNGTIAAKRDNASKGWQFYVDGVNTRLGLFTGFTGINNQSFTPNASLTAGDWTHVAFVYDTTSLLNGPFIYINGVSQTITETLPTLLLQDDSAANFTIGSYNSTDFFAGSIAQVSYYNRLLTRGEVLQDMMMPGSLQDKKLDLPIFGVASPEPDLSSNKNNGVVTGTFPYTGPPSGRSFRPNRRQFISHTINPKIAYTKNLSDALTLSNTLSKDTLKAISQSITLTESNAKDFLKVILQSMTLTELSNLSLVTPSVAYTVDLSLALSLSNTLSKDFLKVIAQNMTITESKSFDFMKVITQSLSVSESNSKDILKAVTQGISLSESKSLDVLKVISQTLTLSNTQSKDILKVISQSLSLSESQTKDFLKVISQSLHLTEAQNLSFVAAVAALLTFLAHGNIDTHDKIAMLNDISLTGILKKDRDFMERDLVATGVIQNDDQDMKLDSDRISWDFDNNQ